MSIHYELSERIAVVTIDRPQVRNAVDAPTAGGGVGLFL